jgi:tetratricopeptide (TPR) repeat protein
MKKQTIFFFMIISLFVSCQDEYEKFEDLADSKMKNKEYEGAIIEYTKAIKSNPKIANLYNERGKAKDSLLDYQGAIEDFTKAIEVADNFPQPKNSLDFYYNNRGMARYYISDYANAVKDFTESMRGGSINFFNRAICKMKLTDYQGAIEDFTKDIDKNGDVPSSYFYRGEIYHHLNQKDKACSDWSKAGELGKAEAYDKIKEFCNKVSLPPIE